MKTNESQRRYLRELESTSDQKFMPMGRIYLSGLLDDLEAMQAEVEILRKIRLVAAQMSNVIFNAKQSGGVNWTRAHVALIELQLEHDALVAELAKPREGGT